MTPNSKVLAHDELEQRVGAAGLEAVDVVVGELCEHGVAVAEQIGLVDVDVHFAVSTIGLHQHVRRSGGCEDEEGKAELAQLYDEKGKRGKPSAAASAVCFDLDCVESVEIEAERRENTLFGNRGRVERVRAVQSEIFHSYALRSNRRKWVQRVE